MAGQVTYLLFASYNYRQFIERVSIERARQLRITIKNELRIGFFDKPPISYFRERQLREADAKNLTGLYCEILTNS